MECGEKPHPGLSLRLTHDPTFIFPQCGDVLMAQGTPDLFSINPHGTFVAYYTQEQMRINGRGTRVSFARLTPIEPGDLNRLADQIYRPNSLLMFDRHFRQQCNRTPQTS